MPMCSKAYPNGILDYMFICGDWLLHPIIFTKWMASISGKCRKFCLEYELLNIKELKK
jgi:hypothetical protein